MPFPPGFTIDSRYIFSVEQVVADKDQARLIHDIRTGGELSSGSFRKDIEPFWRWKSLTLPARQSLPAPVLNYFLNRPYADFDNWAYFSRLDPNLEWEWVECEASTIVRRILTPLGGLFRKLTRVKVDLQIPGKKLPAHRDLICGSVYDNLESESSYAWGRRRLRYMALPWLEEPKPFENIRHEENLYLSMKIPFSERADEPGLPFFILQGRKYHYNSQNRVFF